MTTSRKIRLPRISSSAAAFALAVALPGCSGGSVSGETTPNRGPLSGTLEFRIAVPARHRESALRRPRSVSPATKSIGIVVQPASQPPARPYYVNCTSVCEGLLSEPEGPADVTVTLYDSALGTGTKLGIGSTSLTVAANATTVVQLTFDAIVARASVGVGNNVPLIGRPTTLSNVFSALDPAGYAIVGSGSYVSSDGQPLTFTLSDSDRSGRSFLAPSSLSAPADVRLSLDGRATSGLLGERSALGADSSAFVTYNAPEVHPSAQDPYPGNMGIGSDGKLWFLARGDALGRRNGDGTFTFFATPDRAAFDPQASLFPGAGGDFWIPTAYGEPAQFDRVTTSGAFTVFALPKTFQGDVQQTVLGADGAVWFTVDAEGDTPAELGRVDSSGAYAFYPLSDGSAYLSNLVVGADGNLWFYQDTGSGGRSLVRFAHGTFTQHAVRPGFGGFFVGPDGLFWFPFVNGTSLVKVDTSGRVVTTIRLPRAPAWNAPGERSIAQTSTDGDGNVWFTDPAANAVGRFHGTTVAEYPVYPGSTSPSGIAIAPGGLVYFGDSGSSGHGGIHGGGLGTIAPSEW